MGGGHYVSYSKTAAEKWWCQNDSTCKVCNNYLLAKIHFARPGSIYGNLITLCGRSVTKRFHYIFKSGN